MKLGLTSGSDLVCSSGGFCFTSSPVTPLTRGLGVDGCVESCALLLFNRGMGWDELVRDVGTGTGALRVTTIVGI